jgi:Zn-dependent M16 (insulinase) family peptidase
MGHLDNPIQHIIDSVNLELPLFLHFEHIQTNFVHIELLVSTERVPEHLRPLLSVYMETFFALPMIRDGKRIEYEQVVMELDRDTVNYGINTGREYGNSEAIKLGIQVEIEEYATAVRWLKDLMFSSIFDLERIVTTTQRLLAEIPGEKRSGSAMLQYVQQFFLHKHYENVMFSFVYRMNLYCVSQINRLFQPL